MSPGSFEFALVHSRARKCRRNHLDSLGLTPEREGVAGLIWERMGSLSSPRCVRVYSGGEHRGGRVHSGSRGFTRTRLGVVRFIRDRVG